MPKRVLHVAESLAPDAGSVGIVLRGLFAALQTHDFESTAVTLDGSGASFECVRIVGFDGADAAGPVAEADVIHLHGWGSETARAFAGTALRLGKPLVISPHGALTEGPHNKRGFREKLRFALSEKKLVRRASALTALNDLEANDLRARSLNEEVALLPYGLTFSEYDTDGPEERKLPAAPAGRCLLYLGPIDPVEGLVPLLKAFAGLGPDADEWCVVFAGRDTGDWRKMLEAAVRRKGGTDRVLITTAPDEPAQRAWLARASLVAAPSLHPRCPVSAMQAVAAGVAMIVSDRAAPAGFDRMARVCGPGREQLHETLRSMISLTDEDRKAIGKKNREAARATLDWSVAVDGFVQTYQGVI